MGVRGRRAERRVKRTLLGVCKRDWVCWKMLAGPKSGRVERRKTRAVRKRAFRAWDVEVVRGRGWIVEGARRER